MSGAREELAALAAGLRAQARRLRARGRRTTRLATAPAAAAEPAPRPQPDPPARRAPQPTPTADGAPRPASSDVEALAAQVRDRARACDDLETLRAAVAECTACDLCTTRTQTVFADGTGRARVLFVGEAPGADEDRTGVPFVGRAGQLLTDIVTKGMGLAREDVSIANVLKCRPPGNRDPQPSEKRRCTPWLDRQIELLDPKVIVALGRHAACHLLGVDAPMGRLRGRVHTLNGRSVVPTFHPAFLLRSPHMKKECWKDIQLAMAELGLPLPGRPTPTDPSSGS